MDWIKRMNEALRYLEDGLLDELDIEEVAARAHSSEFHFQRMFFMLTGYSLGEYIRNRRLSKAAQEILTKSSKIIDIALKYGYESPDSFTRAFHRLHGISPRESRKEGVKLKFFAPISFQISVKGETSLNFKIKTMDSFKLAGKGIMTSYSENRNTIEGTQLWEKCRNDGTLAKIRKLAEQPQSGLFAGADVAVSQFEDEDENYYYMIGAETFEDQKDFENMTVPSLTWAIFECRGPVPSSISDVEKRIYSEWFPQSEYEHAQAPALEVLPHGDHLSSDYSCEIWIPVVKKKEYVATSLKFKIKTMGSFKVAGKSFMITDSNGWNEIPQFWIKCYKDARKIAKQHQSGLLAGARVSLRKKFDENDNYYFMVGGETVEDQKDMENVTVPSLTWAIFECRGALPSAIQKIWGRIYSEWFPHSVYEQQAQAPSLEVIYNGYDQSSDYYCEVWIPVVKKRITMV